MLRPLSSFLTKPILSALRTHHHPATRLRSTQLAPMATTTPKYPGLGLPLRYFPQNDTPPKPTYLLGHHGNCWGSDSDLLPVREVAMMAIMDKLTDKPDWERKVFDEVIVARWKKEALEWPDLELWEIATGGKSREEAMERDENGELGEDWDMLNWRRDRVRPLTGIMGEEAWEYCVQELRDKARYYQGTSLIPTLDATSTIVKSDILVPTTLQSSLRAAFNLLQADQASSPDWHPGSNEQVRDLVHPSMYPLVYGRSKGFREEVVGVKDAISKWSGKGNVIAKDEYDAQLPGNQYGGVGGSLPPKEFWSDTYQWLPSNVAFRNDGSVKFTSYVNNLHPGKFPGIYKTVEGLIAMVLPAWDQCLSLKVDYHEKVGAGRLGSRFPKPENPDDENEENWDPPHPAGKDDDSSVGEDLKASQSPTASVDLDQSATQDEEEDDDDEFSDPGEREWHRIRKPVQPALGTFDENDEQFYVPKEGSRLAERYKESGLQVIVKMASIELTPEKPSFGGGGWHVEGQLNERIAATALYYLDSENISESSLSFRMQTSAYMNDDWEVGQDCYHWMEQIYGTGLGGGNSPCLQNYGSVVTKEGRLLAFPNVFQHRVSPFHLTDPTKPGHRRFIALWLIDPTIRIISTANVPPQQLDWWSESIFSPSSTSSPAANVPPELLRILQGKGITIPSNHDLAEGKLPPELNEEVKKLFEEEGSLGLSVAEARKHRDKLMVERGRFHVQAEGEWRHHSYSFCEH